MFCCGCGRCCRVAGGVVDAGVAVVCRRLLEVLCCCRLRAMVQVIVVSRPLLPLLVCQRAFFLFLFLAMFVIPFQGLVDVVRSGVGVVVTG